MKIQSKTDWTEYILGAFCGLLIWLCIMVITEAKTYHDKNIKPALVMQSMYPKIPQCDKKLWLRIREGCKHGK